MFNSVQYVRDVCESQNISISRLEKDCGFSNGYLNPKKMKKISYDRAVIIAKYLNISADSILNGPGKENSPSELMLTEGERSLIELFRLIPEEKQRAFLEMGRLYADSLRKD